MASKGAAVRDLASAPRGRNRSWVEHLHFFSIARNFQTLYTAHGLFLSPYAP